MAQLLIKYRDILYIIAIVVCLAIWQPWVKPEVLGEIKLSEGRQQILEEELVKKTKEIDSLHTDFESKLKTIKATDNNPQIVHRSYESKINRVANLPPNAAVKFFASRYSTEIISH